MGLTFAFAIIAVLLRANYPTGPHTITFDQSILLIMSIGTVVMLFIKPIILAFFDHMTFRIVSAIYQAFLAIIFLGLMLVGFLFPSVWVIVIGIGGAIVNIGSIIAKMVAGTKGSAVTTFYE
ncbi:hypothetical protein HNO89_003532 [Sporosarcina luteola]|nr:hypothetical protein [Sporosarcina luteola]